MLGQTLSVPKDIPRFSHRAYQPRRRGDIAIRNVRGMQSERMYGQGTT
jgi:hypothetical protein